MPLPPRHAALLRAAFLCAASCPALIQPALAQPSAAQPAPAVPPAGLVTTHAQAHRRLPNTVSDVAVSIEVHARDLPDAAAQLARRSQTLLDYLRGEHAERLRSDAVGMNPDTEEQRGRPDRIIGYTGRASVSFRATPDTLPALLAGCLDHGASGVGDDRASPRESEVDQTSQELASEAARAALAQAAAVAEALGERLASVAQVEVDPADRFAPSPAPPPARMMPAGRPTPPIATEAGGTDISVGVTLTARITPQP